MLTTSQVAAKAKVSHNTVRNYVRDYPDLFSEAARGLQGNRQFDDEDVEALCSLVALRFAGLPVAEAAERLRTQEIPTLIDVPANPPATELQVGVQATVTLQARIEALEREQRGRMVRALWSHGVAFYLGMVTMGTIFLLVWWLVNR